MIHDDHYGCSLPGYLRFVLYGGYAGCRFLGGQTGSKAEISRPFSRPGKWLSPGTLSVLKVRMCFSQDQSWVFIYIIRRSILLTPLSSNQYYNLKRRSLLGNIPPFSSMTEIPASFQDREWNLNTHVLTIDVPNFALM